MIDEDLDPGAVAHPEMPRETACERCGTFAELVHYDGHAICDECIGRLSEIEREPPTVTNLLSGSAWVLSRVGVLGALIVALADLPIVLVEVFLPDSPSFISTAWGVTVSVVAQGAVFSVSMRAIRGEELSLRDAVQHSLSAAGRIISANLFAAVQIFLYLLLLIVPGFVRALSLVLVIPIALHEPRAAGDIVRNSAERMKGHRATALGAYLAWGVVWGVGFAAYLGFILALDMPVLLDVPVWVIDGALLGSGLLLPVLMLPVMCTTAVLYAKTLKLRTD